MDQSPFDPSDKGWKWWAALIFSFSFSSLLRIFKARFQGARQLLILLLETIVDSDQFTLGKETKDRKHNTQTAKNASLDQTIETEFSYFRLFNIKIYCHLYGNKAAEDTK